MTQFMSAFRPVDGALLDLDSLSAISDAWERELDARMRVVWPGVSSLILDGLEPVGDWAPTGPPGTVRPDPQADHLMISAGSAVIMDDQGHRHIIRIDEPVRVPWPNRNGPAIRGLLVLKIDARQASGAREPVVARESLAYQLGYVRTEVFLRDAKTQRPTLLPIMAAVGNGQDWAADLRRVFQPEHPAVRALLKRIEALERQVWRAEPEGAVWDREVLGREWLRYQVVAASALQAARTALSARSSTTLERARMLHTLYVQLNRSVESAANQLLQVFGPQVPGSPYRSDGIGADEEEEW